jgi:hypothetical protein
MREQAILTVAIFFNVAQASFLALKALLLIRKGEFSQVCWVFVR